MKKKLVKIISKGSHGSKLNLVFDYAIMMLILLNLIAIIFETIPEIKQSFGAFLRFFEILSVIVFSIEYILRLIVADITHPSSSKLKSILKFIFSGYGMVDLLAVLPFYMPFLIAVDLRFLRILRMLRFLRVFKINRYNHSLNLLWSVIREKKSELLLTGFITFLVLLIASFLMYYIEGETQPDKFSDIPHCFWWAIATLTTVGYGDVYPITAMGKVISSVIAVLGIGIVALPTGLIGAGFMEKIKVKTENQKCPHCGEEILNQE